MRIADMTWMQVEEWLEEDDRCVLPLGSTEQHAYLSLAVDAVLAETVAEGAADTTGVPVFPVVSYGLTPYFMGFPGTVTLSQGTYEVLLVEILGSLVHHGFRRILIVNGHGGNTAARPAAEAWADTQEGVLLRWHDWWKAPETMAAVKSLDPDASHASWMEGFPWTRVEGVEPPEGHKEPVDLEKRHEMSPEEFRELIGDGSFGGDYTRPDQELMEVWRVAVKETRRKITEGW